MKKCLMAVALAASTAIVAAQGTSVTLVKVLDTATSRSVTGSVYASTYVPGANKFIASKLGTHVEVFNGLTGAYETDMSLSGITVGGLGFFALTATENGVIYGMEDGGKDIWRWGAVSDPAPYKVYDTANFARVGYTGTVGSDVTIAFTGSGSGDAATVNSVQFFSDTFPFSTSSFSFNETVDLQAKSSLAMSNDGNVVFTAIDSGPTAIQKWIKTNGVWGATPAWSVGSVAAKTGPGGGPMAYDNTHDILFVAPVTGSPKKILALDGATGNTIGEVTVTNALSTTTGYAGGFAAPTLTGGTVYLVGRGATASSPVMYVYTYVVPGAGVDDWSLYKQ